MSESEKSRQWAVGSGQGAKRYFFRASAADFKKIPVNEITLTCNPYYRYGKEVNRETHEKREKEQEFRDFSAFRGSRIWSHE